MDVLSSRILIRPRDRARSTAFYRDLLGLAVYREFPGGTVFFLGGGFLKLSGSADAPAGPAVAQKMALWLQVRDHAAAPRELADHVVRQPRQEPWGLHEM